MKKTPLLLVCLLALLALPACSDGGNGEITNGEPTLVPDFELLDVNPDSEETFNTLVSPRDEIGHVTGWFFGAAT